MKISISTLPFKTFTLEEVIHTCKENGYDAMELRTDYHEWSSSNLSDDHYKSMLQQIKDNGLSVSDLGSGVIVAEYSAKDVVAMKRQFEIATILEAPGIRIMLGYPRRHTSMPLKTIDYEGMYRWLKEVDIMAGTYGKQIWIETHNEYATGKSLKDLYSKVELKNTEIIWDIMHPLEEGETVDETLEYIYDHIKHVHIKDGFPWEDPEMLVWKYTPVGTGCIPIGEIVEKLKARGYSAYYSLEWESAWRDELKALNCDEKEVIKFPNYMKRF